jgi:hypothetical protein
MQAYPSHPIVTKICFIAEEIIKAGNPVIAIGHADRAAG